MTERYDAFPGAVPDPEDDWSRFRDLLNSEYTFPASYLFKFIVPRDGLPHVEGLLSESELTFRASRKGNYVSVTAEYRAESAEAIIDIYESASRIPGVISL